MTWHLWHESFICVTSFIHIFDMNHSYVRHDSILQNKEVRLLDESTYGLDLHAFVS